VRPFLVSFIVLFALAVAGAAERAQQGTVPPVPPLPESQPAASSSTATKDTPKETLDGFDNIVRPFVTENCVPCHGYKKQKNGLNLESYESAGSLRDEHERWAEVVKKLRAREMPPEEEPQPPEHQRQAVAGWLAMSTPAYSRFQSRRSPVLEIKDRYAPRRVRAIGQRGLKVAVREVQLRLEDDGYVCVST